MEPALPVPESAARGVRERHFYFDLWRMLRRRRWLLFFSALAGLGLGLGFYLYRGPEYQASARILVIKKRLETSPLSLPSPPQGLMEDYLSTHQVVIASPRVVQAAIKDAHLESLPCFADADNLTLAVLNSLAVDRVFKLRGGNPPNNILNVAFRASNPEDAKTVLEAILASYHKFLGETYRNVNAEALELISRARDVLRHEVETREAAYIKFRETAPLVWKRKDGSSLQEDRVFSFDAKRSALRMRLAEIDATLAAIEQAQKRGAAPAEMLVLTSLAPAGKEPGAEFMVPRDTGSSARPLFVTLHEELIGLQLQEAKLLETLGPNHPQVQSLRQRMEIVRGLVTPKAATGQEPSGQTQRVADLLQVRVEMLKQELTESRRAEQALAKLLEAEQNDVKAVTVAQAQEEGHRKGIEHSHLLYQSIIKRLQELDTVKDYGGYDTQILAAPERGLWLWKTPLFLTGIGGLFGTALGFALAGWLEMRNRRFQTPGQIRRALETSAVHHLPRFASAPASAASNGKPLHPSLVAIHSPDGHEAQALRAVGLAMAVPANGRPQQIVQVTSPEDGDGKTTLAANLAIILAQAGKKTLLLDADFRHPQLHTLFGLAPDKGLSSLLRGSSLGEGNALAEAIQPTPVANLDLLPAGPIAGPTELGSSPRLAEILKTLRAKYDVILIDSSSLLSTADASAIAGKTDGVLLTLRLDRNGRTKADLAKTLLEGFGARILAVVVNGLPVRYWRQMAAASHLPEDFDY